MRLVAISDIHGNIDALEAVMASIAGEYDHLLVLGDLVGIGPAPEAVTQWVVETKPIVIRGNWDDYVAEPATFARFEALAEAPVPLGGKGFQPPVPMPLLRENRAWSERRLPASALKMLRALPSRITLRFGGALTIDLFHASPRSLEAGLPHALEDDELVARAESSAKVTLFGHTHQPYHRLIQGQHFVNVSSVGLPLDGDPRAAYTVIEQREGVLEVEQHRVAYDVDAAIHRLRRQQTPGMDFVEHIFRTGRPMNP